MIKFSIPGPPKAKGRPRFARAGKFVRTYTPKESASYENLVKLSFMQAHQGPPTNSPVKVEIVAFFPIPKTSLRKAEKELAKQEIYPLTKKPDVDNLIKSVLDGLNGVAFTDDKQVFHVSCSKWYSETPRTVVSISMFNEVS